MRSTLSLYEVLGVGQDAGLAELQAAYRRQFGALEAARAEMNPQAFDERMQLLRLALSTLADPASRLSYDTKLAARRAALTEPMPLAPVARERAVAETVRAFALALRADALSLTADAMLLRAGVDAPAAGAGEVARTVATGTLRALKYFVRA
ncbi:MAG TPA: DnaJ domain-containing protein, partial [Burkholderiales bacterium]|nr:DnaJ domain-containing protein [Burkholderiales bacterium]